VFEAAVIGFLDFVRETAGGELFHSEMVLNAITADAVSWAARIGAVTKLLITCFLAIHKGHLNC
jgi:hypothetical protein